MSQISRALKVKKNGNVATKIGEKPNTTVSKVSSKSRRSRSVDQQGSACQTHITDFFQRRSSRKVEAQLKLDQQHAMEKRILDGDEDGLKVEYFEDKGRGVVATRPFQRGDYVVEYFGELITVTEAHKREEKYAADPTVGCYMFYFSYKGRRLCIDATSESGRMGRLANHKRNGNCVTKAITFSGSDVSEKKKSSKDNASEPRPRVILVASRDISAGEEIMYDYGDRSPDSIASHPWLAC